ncbi:shikimate kinase [Mucisphaera calidilacus]|uniref:Shikimate kinase n=1 Tax=Mucisphaera calidilacus TaxID=2527982 RepID=A0A518BZ81_9BACT|nr:shikimate kinase [Mucisphaera calidilacus]QDU72282.1 Shikimate kinase 2 [Mucisphaera calidilacus]
MDIVLIGYRASGKSSVGKRLAHDLERPFIDTDDLVRAHFQGDPISTIFANHGEPAFRAAETDIALDVLKRTNFVAAFGGGTPVQPRVTQALEDWPGLCVYLSAPAHVLAQRIDTDAGPGADRPSLTGQASAADEVARVLTPRIPIYQRCADLTIDVATTPIPQVIQQILDHLR